MLYDVLPAEVRVTLRNMLHEPRVPELANAYYSMTAFKPQERALIIASLALNAEQSAIETTANTYARRYGAPYPHKAAQATVLRSEPLFGLD